MFLSWGGEKRSPHSHPQILALASTWSPTCPLQKLFASSGHHVSDSGPRIQGFERICCCCSVAKLYLTLYDPMTEARQASLSFIISQSLLRFMFLELVMPSNHLILCRPFLLLPSIFPSIRMFPNESVLCIRWPKYWSFSFNISPSNEYSRLISFRIDWLDLLAVQGTLKSSKASILRCSAFFIVQFSHPYMTTGKTKALTIGAFVGKVMSLLFNVLSGFVIAFLPRSKHLLK